MKQNHFGNVLIQVTAKVFVFFTGIVECHLLRHIWLVFHIIVGGDQVLEQKAPQGQPRRFKCCMKLRTWAILFLLVIPAAAKADEFSFTFQGSANTASGIFFTDPPKYAQGYYGSLPVTSISGVFAGASMTIFLDSLGFYGAIAPDTLSLFPYWSAIQFTANGQHWSFSRPDPVPGDTLGLHGCLLWNYGTGTAEAGVLALTPVPEPSTATLLILSICLLWAKRTKHFFW
jgi:hypothetical protein